MSDDLRHQLEETREELGRWQTRYREATSDLEELERRVAVRWIHVCIGYAREARSTDEAVAKMKAMLEDDEKW